MVRVPCRFVQHVANMEYNVQYMRHAKLATVALTPALRELAVYQASMYLTGLVCRTCAVYKLVSARRNFMHILALLQR